MAVYYASKYFDSQYWKSKYYKGGGKVRAFGGGNLPTSFYESVRNQGVDVEEEEDPRIVASRRAEALRKKREKILNQDEEDAILAILLAGFE
jgi:hypothetical protein